MVMSIFFSASIHIGKLICALGFPPAETAAFSISLTRLSAATYKACMGLASL